MKIGSLCSGYGGLDIAVEALTGAETVWHSEFDKHANKVYETHWSNPNLGDLTNINWETVPTVDILTGGYPCQPFSQAGNRKGTNDKRHIFPYIANAIRILQPRFVFLENVRGHLTLGFDSVLRTLTEIGYDAKWTLARASDIGAPHRRERLFIIAFNANSYRLQTDDTPFINRTERPQYCGGYLFTANTINNQQPRDGQVQELGRGYHSCDNLSELQQWGRYAPAIQRWEQLTRCAPVPLNEDKLSPKFIEWMMGLPNGWVTDVEISRSQQMKILGNGVVPQQAYMAYKHLLEMK